MPKTSEFTPKTRMTNIQSPVIVKQVQKIKQARQDGSYYKMVLGQKTGRRFVQPPESATQSKSTDAGFMTAALKTRLPEKVSK